MSISPLPTSPSLTEAYRGLDMTQRIGAAITEKFLGEEGVMLWFSVRDAVKRFYGEEKAVELSAGLFGLARKAAKLHAKGKIDSRTAAPINDPLLSCMSVAFHTVTAEGGGEVDVGWLSRSVQCLHDAILPLLRQFVLEDVMEPRHALSLTNACICLGFEGFLRAFMEGKEYEEERKKLGVSLSLLLARFKHPDFTASGIPHFVHCARHGCVHAAVVHGLCKLHTLAWVEQQRLHPSFSAALPHPDLLSKFVAFLAEENDGMEEGSGEGCGDGGGGGDDGGDDGSDETGVEGKGKELWWLWKRVDEFRGTKSGTMREKLRERVWCKLEEEWKDWEKWIGLEEVEWVEHWREEMLNPPKIPPPPTFFQPLATALEAKLNHIFATTFAKAIPFHDYLDNLAAASTRPVSIAGRRRPREVEGEGEGDGEGEIG